MSGKSTKILITGGSGLIGSHLIEALLQESATDLYVLGRYCKPEWIGSGVTHLPVDFATHWDTSLLPSQIDRIIHLCQSENFRDFPASAAEVFNVNTLSTMKLIDYAQKAGATHFIYASSGGLYGNDQHPFSEKGLTTFDKRLGFYQATKHCSEVILENYSSLLHVITLRLFFVYGKGQRKDMLMPRLINSVREGKPIMLSGEEGIRIQPTCVSDAVRAIRASFSLTESQIINVAGPQIKSMKQIADLIGASVGKDPVFRHSTAVPDIVADTARMREILCEPLVDVAAGIQTVL